MVNLTIFTKSFLSYIIIIVFGQIISIHGYCIVPKLRQGIAFKCSKDNKNFHCKEGESVEPGTELEYGCRLHYYHSIEKQFITQEIICGNNFQWDDIQSYQDLICSPACGHNFNYRKRFWPWYAMIFYIGPDESRRFLCGGSLINPWARGFGILTTANCITKMYENRRVPNIENFSVVLGGNSSHFEDNFEDGNQHAKDYKLKGISLDPNYKKSGFTTDNIALLHLRGNVKLSDYVLPGCLATVDTADTQLLERKSKGTIVGFNEYGERTGSLLSTQIEILDTSSPKCQNLLSGRQQNRLFCGRYHSGTRMCGDSSSGLAIPQKSPEKFYIQGLPMTDEDDDGCEKDSNSAVLFTKVSTYVTWIRDELDKFSHPTEPPPPQTPRLFVTYYTPPSTTTTTSRPTPSSSTEPPFNMTMLDQDFTMAARGPPELKMLTKRDIQNLVPYSGGFEDYEIAALAFHNFYRNYHQVPPLTLNRSLSYVATNAARFVLDRNLPLGYRSNEYSAPNRYEIRGDASLDNVVGVTIATGKLYRSKREYSYSNPKATAYSAIVWKSSTDLGVGVAKRGDRIIYEFNYYPSGNKFIYWGDGSVDTSKFTDNVFPLRKPY